MEVSNILYDVCYPMFTNTFPLQIVYFVFMSIPFSHTIKQFNKNINHLALIIYRLHQVKRVDH